MVKIRLLLEQTLPYDYLRGGKMITIVYANLLCRM
jgi:hypothetical protein